MKALFFSYIFFLTFLTVNAHASAGDICTNAIDLGTPSNSVPTVKTGIRIDKDDGPRNRWYKFTAPENPNGGDYVGVQLNYLNTDDQNETVNLSFRQGICGTLKILSSVTRGGKKRGNNVNQNLYYSLLEPGEEYYIRLNDQQDNRTNLQMTLRFYDTINRSSTFKLTHHKNFTTPLYQANLTGDIISIGNSNYCTDFDRNGQCDLEGSTSLTSGNQAGNVIPINAETTVTINNDGNVPFTLASNTVYDNQSKANLSVPSGAKIKWAGLFWMGTIEDSSNLSKEPHGVLDERREAARKIIFGLPDGSMHSLTGDIHSGVENTTDTNTSDFRWIYYHVSFDATERDVGNTEVDDEATYTTQYSGGTLKNVNLYGWSHKDAFLYQGYVNVTSLLKSWETMHSGDASGIYSVANITSDTGHLRPVGVLGAWNLVIIYEDDSAEFRNISITDGFAALYDGHNQDAIIYAKLNGDPRLNTAITEDANTGAAPSIGMYDREVKFDISGFFTPKAPNTVNSTLTMFLGDGEGNPTVAEALFITQGGTESDGGTFVEIDNGPGWNGAITNKDGTNYLDRSPNLVPVLAIDIRNFPAELDNEQLATTIKMQISSDRILFGVIGFSTDLRKPKLCYDYAYSQYGRYFTEDYIEADGPYIEGSIDNGEPIDVKLYIKVEEESDVTAKDLTISILDMNTSYATYKSDSTLVTPPNSIVQNPIDDTNLTIAPDDSSVEFIPVGDIDGLEYFYLFYSLDTHNSTINMPLKARVDFNVSIPTSPTEYFDIDYHIFLKDISVCNVSSEYTPGRGIFNIVHDHYQDNSLTSEYFYNLPTQVTSRAGNFHVLSMDPDNLDTTQGASTMVAVELINAAAFHDVNVSCQEQSSAINKRVWITFENNNTSEAFNKAAIDLAIAQGRTELSSSIDFYKEALENAAFRVSFNLDNNSSLMNVETLANGKKKLVNFTAVAGDKCSPGFKGLGTVSSNCGSNGTGKGTGMNPAELTKCMECIYGLKTKLVCSRDNFAIRPESFLINIDDQNETTTKYPPAITDGYSGVSGAISNTLNLSAGYVYHIEVNATNHSDNNASHGYVRYFNSDVQFTWNGPLAPSVCNDDTNKSLSNMNFIHGNIDVDIPPVNQVGNYNLNITDDTWTHVDNVVATHHTNYNTQYGTYFTNYADCIQNSSNTEDTISNALNGCSISSNHLNTENNFQYNDHNILFHPYQFALTNSVTLGIGDVAPSIVFKPFVYMANISQDENMSVHLNSTITAQGKNGSTLNNFVSGCYSQPLQIQINKSNTSNTALSYSYIVHNEDINSSIIPTQSISGNLAAGTAIQNPNFSTLNTFFQKNQNGTMRLKTNLNFDRQINVPTNPEDVTFISISADDNITIFNANLKSNEKADGNVSINQRVLHYYGRTNAPKVTIECNSKPCTTGTHTSSTSNTKDFIYYEVYCLGGSCNTTILPNGTVQTNDVRWYTNNNHDMSGQPLGTDGVIGTITEVTPSGNVVEVSRNIDTANFKTEAIIKYNGPLPYDAQMQMASSKWLLYNASDANATANKFTIEFIGDGGWSGKFEEDSTTKTTFSPITNKRIMW